MPYDAEKLPTTRSRAALGVGAVLLVVLVLLLLGGRQEIARSWGLTGEQGDLRVDGCSRTYGLAMEEQRTTCRGRFRPLGHGEATYDVEALVAADPGDLVRVGADGPDELAYRSDLWGRWAAISLPLLVLGVLWVIPWARRLLRVEGRASHAQVVQFLGLGLAPSVVLLVAGTVGFFVSLTIS